jgi:ribonuclease E
VSVTPAAAPAPAAQIVIAPVQDKAALHAIVQAAGLQWVESSPERVAQALASQQTTPVKLGRDPKPAEIVSSVPLMQIETRV